MGNKHTVVPQTSHQEETFNYGLLTVHDHSEQTVKERLEALMPAADDFMENLKRTVKLHNKREFSDTAR